MADDSPVGQEDAILDWALDAHAAGKRREDILATAFADALHAQASGGLCHLSRPVSPARPVVTPSAM